MESAASKAVKRSSWLEMQTPCSFRCDETASMVIDCPMASISMRSETMSSFLMTFERRALLVLMSGVVLTYDMAVGFESVLALEKMPGLVVVVWGVRDIDLLAPSLEVASFLAAGSVPELYFGANS